MPQKNSTANNKPKQKRIAEFRFNFDLKTIFIVLFCCLFIYQAFTAFAGDANKALPEKPISTLVKEIKQGKIKYIEIFDNKVLVNYKNDTTAVTYKEQSEGFSQTLKNFGVEPSAVDIRYKDTQSGAALANFLINVIPTILFIAFFVFMFRQARGAQDSVFSFGQSKAKRFNKDLPKITFKDVAGVDEAKKELEEIVDFLKHPEKYKKLGARTPKGVILIGPAGSGKTLLAKAVAGEANVPFFSIAGSEFMEMLVGIGAARARDLFATAKKSAPAIIFIDEIDAIGRARSSGVMSSHDEREQTLNQILVEMDGFTPNEQVIVMAATNRGDLLDPALLRPGRFDRRVIVDYPDVAGRKSILQIHARNKPVAVDVDWEKIARRTVGFSGADIENMLNEAAINAARHTRDTVNSDDIEEAAIKVKLGPAKKRVQTEYDKKLTAYHEAGHAIVSHFLKNTDPVQRISIVSRGMALGYTLIHPDTDKLHETKTNLMERITAMMGGRAAEEMIFNEVTTGAANDFDQATRIAKAMVIEYGMSDLGPINFGPNNDITEWGKTYWEQNNVSQEVQAKIDDAVKKIITAAYEEAKTLVIQHKASLDAVADELIKTENMDKEEFEKIVGKREGTAQISLKKSA